MEVDKINPTYEIKSKNINEITRNGKHPVRMRKEIKDFNIETGEK